MGILIEMIKRFNEKKECQPNKKKCQPERYWCEIYKVRGINPATKRKKSIEVVAASNDSTETIQSKSGLLPPYEVTIATRPASNAQLEALRKHGITFLDDISMADAGIFIDRGVNEEPTSQPVAPLSFIDYAIKNDIYLSKYASAEEARDLLLELLPENTKEIRSLK